MATLDKTEIQALLHKLEQVQSEVAKAIVGQQDVVQKLMISLLAGGHCLLEGVPGLAKTLMVNALSQALDLSFNRVQFTPDLMPSDIIGTEVLETDHDSGQRFFKFQKGPVFTNILLADEINRTPAKTQAALLEAMQEKHVSYAGEHYPLPKPFFVLATQNPVEQSGTYPLPEAQLDRFLMFVNVGYPSQEDEREILKRTTGTYDYAIDATLSSQEIIQLQNLVREVEFNDDLLNYVTELVRNTRPQGTSISEVSQFVSWGAGPRAGQALVLCAKAHALLNKRFVVTLSDIQSVLPSVLSHRILLTFQAQAQQQTVESVIDAIVNGVSAPASPLA